MAEVELPYEIWLLISQYIPDSALLKMYSVNRAFFNIAMDMRYSFMVLHDYREHTVLERLKQPSLAQRVRSLTFGLDSLATTLSRPPQDIVDSIKRAFLAKSSRTRNLSSMWFLERVSQMCNVSTCILQCYSIQRISDLSLARPILDAGFKAFSQSLHTLVFDLPLEAFHCLPISSLTLPQLQNLTLGVSRAYKAIDTAPVMKDVVAGFINRHSTTLTSITFFSPGTDNITPLLQHIGHLPSLQTLQFTHSTPFNDPAYISGHRHLFLTHQDTLSTLCLEFQFSQSQTLKIWGPPPHFLVHFRELKKLTVTLPGDARQMPSLVESLRCVHDPLTKLTVKGTDFSYAPLSDLLAPRSVHSNRDPTTPSLPYERGIPTWTNLRYLHIRLFFLSPRILQLMGSQMCNLEYLKLNFEYYMCNAEERARTADSTALGHPQPGTYSINQHQQLASFETDLRSCSLEAWGLVHLALHRFGSVTWNYETTQFERLILEAMPSALKIFNGVYLTK